MAILMDWLDTAGGEDEFEVEHLVDSAEMHGFLAELECEFLAHHQDELSED